ncbi:MAG: hypothetical protein KAG64_06035 [Bacteroidales bacterium]|nr:hypothetical protein [Bacteroidales bacterium]
MKKTLFTLIGILSISMLFSQNQEQWNEAYGGAKNDEARSIIETKDGGFLVVGYTESQGSGKKDGWAMKLREDGSMDWDMTYGGGKDDELYDVIELDNGYAMVGGTASIGEGKEDFWLVIIDKEGSQEWERAYGGSKEDVATQVIHSNDGNIYIAGYTKSKGSGGRDIYFLKVEPFASEKERGKLLWKKNFGGGGTDFPGRIKLNPQDSFIYIIGSSNSSGNGGLDATLYKMDPVRGNIRTKKNFGGRAFEHGNDFCFTENNGYIIVGGTMTNSKGFFDSWVIKLEEEFYSEWEHTYGGGKEDEWVSVVQFDNSYLMAGFTGSKGEGKLDAWLMMLDKNGKTMWEKTFGDVGNDIVSRMIKTKDGGFICAGSTNSFGEGGMDFWIVKFK